jgi:Domain of unknown function (DUF1707)/Cell wall-active antibiotics response 4TMS YvqF
VTDDPSHDVAVRASDAERDHAADLLRRHAAAGRLTLEELAQRVEAAYSATTRDELAALTRDLPLEPVETRPQPRSRGRPTRWSVAVMSGITRRGRWRLAPSSRAVAVMGGVELDLREAEIDGPEVVIDAIAVMGSVVVLVPDAVDVELSGFALMGGKEFKPGPLAPPPGAPFVRVRGFALMGSVDVRVPRAAG